MKRIIVPALLSIGALFVIAASPSHVPESHSKEAVIKYVESAAGVVAKLGPAACAELKTPAWTAGEWYIFVVGPDGKVFCHPTADIIGKAQDELVDANGKHFGQEMGTKAAGTGKGWVDYVWPKPGATKPEPKRTYVMGIAGADGKHYVVGSGSWDLK
jgi:cytochrome c